MGIDYTTNLGPYVECKTEMVDIEKTIRACTSWKCGLYEHRVSDTDTQFCIRCGSPIGLVPHIEKINKVDTEDVIDEMDDALMIPGGDDFYNWSEKYAVDLWLPNGYRPNEKVRIFSFDPMESIQYAEITHEMIDVEITEFNNQYSKSLDILRKHYGSEKVTVKWGLIHTIY